MAKDNEYWVDPDVPVCAELAAASVGAARAHCPAEERRHFAVGLPGYRLEVEGLGGAATDLLCLAFAHLRGRDARIPGDTVQRLEWTIVDRRHAPGVAEMPIIELGDYGVLNRSAENDLLLERRSGMSTLFDVRRLRFTTVVDDLSQIQHDVLAKPLLRFLMGLLFRRGLVLAHAALVGRGGRGMLVTGQGGQGKSTISAAALLGGLEFCSDDFVAIERRGARFFGHSLFGSILLNPHAAVSAPAMSFAMLPDDGSGQKALVPVAHHFPRQATAALEIDAIAVPRIAGGPVSRLMSSSRGAALRALAPTSVFFSPWREAGRADMFFALAEAMPAFVYDSGSNFAGISQPLKARYAG